MAGALVAFAVLLAACGGGGEREADAPEATSTPTGEQAPSPTEAASPTPEDEDQAATVTVTSSPLGRILTDAEGRSLYGFAQDGDGESTCYGECEQTWPPLVVDGSAEAGEGVDASLLGTAERTDGSIQATYGGKPLYYFEGDMAPGETNGQGVGGVWFAVSPQGEFVQPDDAGY